MSQITPKHFSLLQSFGKTEVQKRLSPEDRERLWEMSCQQQRLHAFPLAQVIEAWKEFIEARSSASGIVLSEQPDPDYVGLGISYNGLICAAHTGKIAPLLKRLLKLYANTFASYEAFLAALMKLAPAPRQK